MLKSNICVNIPICKWAISKLQRAFVKLIDTNLQTTKTSVYLSSNLKSYFGHVSIYHDQKSCLVYIMLQMNYQFVNINYRIYTCPKHWRNAQRLSCTSHSKSLSWSASSDCTIIWADCARRRYKTNNCWWKNKTGITKRGNCYQVGTGDLWSEFK